MRPSGPPISLPISLLTALAVASVGLCAGSTLLGLGACDASSSDVAAERVRFDAATERDSAAPDAVGAMDSAGAADVEVGPAAGILTSAWSDDLDVEVDASDDDGDRADASLPFAFVVSAGGRRFAILETITDDARFVGDIERVELSPEAYPVTLTRGLTDARLPAAFAANGGRVRVFSSAGVACAARLGTPRAMVRAALPYELAERWAGTDGATTSDGAPTDIEVAETMWADFESYALLAAPLEDDADCTDARFATPASSSPPPMLSQVSRARIADARDIERRALAQFVADPAHAALQREYVRDGWGTGAWDESREASRDVRFLQNNTHATTVAVVSATTMGSCGDFYGSLYIAYEVQADGSLREIDRGDVGATPELFTDADRDGTLDVVTRDALFLHGSAGVARDIVPPSTDCPC